MIYELKCFLFLTNDIPVKKLFAAFLVTLLQCIKVLVVLIMYHKVRYDLRCICNPMYLFTLLDRPSVSLSSCHVLVNLYAQTCQISLILQDKSFTCGKIIPSLTRVYFLIILHVFFL